MLKIIVLAVAFALQMGNTYIQPEKSTNVIVIENETLTGLSLPPYGTLCTEVEVKGRPSADARTLYILPVGTVVQLREQPRINPRDWVMIEPARWIPLSAVCQ